MYITFDNCILKSLVPRPYSQLFMKSRDAFHARSSFSMMHTEEREGMVSESHMMYAIHIKGGGRVIIEHGRAKS